MNYINYDIRKKEPCLIGYQYDHNSTRVTFEGFTMEDETNALYLKFKGREPYLIPIAAYSIVVTQPLTKHPGVYECQLEERKADGTYVAESMKFEVRIAPSIKADAEYEVQDSRLETVYEEYNRLYQVLVNTDAQIKRDMAAIKMDYADVRDDLESDYSTTKANLAADYAATKTQLSNEIRTETRAAENRLSDNIEQRAELLNEMVEGLDGDVAEALTEVREGVSQIDGMKSTVDRHGQKISILEMNDLAHGSSLMNLENQQAATASKANKNAADIQNLQMNDLALGGRLMEAEDDIQYLKEHGGSSYDDTEIREEIASKVGFTDYASQGKSGVIVPTAWNGLTVLANGEMRGEVASAESYKARNNYHIISKGTLENVLNIERTKITELERKNDALWKLNQGQTYDVYESASEDYAKVVPSGSHYASVDVVGGKSVVWNQHNYAENATSVGINKVVDGYNIKYSGVATSTYLMLFADEALTSIPIGHKVYCYSKDSNGYPVNFRDYVDGSNTYTNHQFERGIFTVANGFIRPRFANQWVSGDTVNGNVDIFIVDLTQMFGAGNEPTSTDDPRIKMIEKYAEEHPEYNEGEIISSQVDAVDVRGKNLLNNNGELVERFVGIGTRRWGYIIPTIAGETYTVSVKGISIPRSTGIYQSDLTTLIQATSDSTKTFVATGDFVFNCYVSSSAIANAQAYYDDVYIQIERGTTATPYTPYIKNEYPTNFPPLNSAGTVYDYVDVDKGELHRRVGVVDMGTLNWTENGEYLAGKVQFFSYVAGKINGFSNILTQRYENQLIGAARDFTISGRVSSNGVSVNEPNAKNITELKQLISGQMLYYELAEEIIEPIDIPSDLTEWLECEANGTITFVNDQKLLVPNTERFVRKLNEVT